jgi:hypothetical protein
VMWGHHLYDRKHFNHRFSKLQYWTNILWKYILCLIYLHWFGTVYVFIFV